MIESKDNVIAAGTAIKADGLHATAHGPSGGMALASATPAMLGAAHLDLRHGAAGAAGATQA